MRWSQNLGTLEHSHLPILIWATRPSSAPRCHEGVWRRCLRRHSLFTCLKKEEVSVPAFQPRGDLGGSGWKPAQTNFQAISGFASWNTRRHSECSSLFQRSSRGSGQAVSEGGGHWARRPAGSNRTGAGSRSAPPPRPGAAPVARRRRLAQSGVPACRFQRAVPFQAVPVCQDRVWWEGGRFEPREQHQSTRNRISRRLRY